MPQKGQAPSRLPSYGRGSYEKDVDKFIQKSGDNPNTATGKKEYPNTYTWKNTKGEEKTYYKDPSMHAPGMKFKNGGLVKKTGTALVHKGERVLTASQAKGFRKK